MGQYYYGVLRNKDNGEIRAVEYQGKLCESWIRDFLLFCFALSSNGGYDHSRVIWAGDYSTVPEQNYRTLYHHARYLEQEKRISPPENFKKVAGFLCNHDRKEYIDITKAKEKYMHRDQLNPLALLCSDPTCRCQGGGDYIFREGFDMVSRWYNQMLSTEPIIPDGYTELELPFTVDGHPVWIYDTLIPAITGKEYAWHIFVPFVSWLDRTQDNIFWRIKDLDQIKQELRTFLDCINVKKVRKVFNRFIQDLENGGNKESSTIKVSYEEYDFKKTTPFVKYEGLRFFIDIVDDKIVWPKCNVIYDNELAYTEKNGSIHSCYAGEIKKLRKLLS